MSNSRQISTNRGGSSSCRSGIVQDRFHALFFALAVAFTAAVVFGVVP